MKNLLLAALLVAPAAASALRHPAAAEIQNAVTPAQLAATRLRERGLTPDDARFCADRTKVPDAAMEPSCRAWRAYYRRSIELGNRTDPEVVVAVLGEPLRREEFPVNPIFFQDDPEKQIVLRAMRAQTIAIAFREAPIRTAPPLLTEDGPVRAG